MSLSGKVTVVLGVTGQVGTGVAHAHLVAGATVVFVSRELARAQKIEHQLLELTKVSADHAIAVQGDFSSEKASYGTVERIVQALKGKKIDHVINTMSYAPTSKISASESDGRDLQAMLDEYVFIHVHAAHQFIPMLKDREGSSYIQLSGGLAHVCFNPQQWLATAKNSLLNGLALGYVSESKDWKLRFFHFCIHFGVVEVGNVTLKSKGFGMDSVDSRDLGPFFVAVATSKVPSQSYCGTSAKAALEASKAFPQ